MKKLTSDLSLPLSETDKREVCDQHGWVGRKRFQQERHDLCEPSREDPIEDDEDDEDDEAAAAADDESHEDEPVVDNEGADLEEAAASAEPLRWSRAAARRQGIPSKKTLAVRRITQLELAAGRAELHALGADEPYDRPRTRGDCQWCPVCQLVRDGKSNGFDNAALRALGRSTSRGVDREGRFGCGHSSSDVVYRSRPCVFVSCKQSLFLDVSETGSIILNFPHLEPGEMPPHRSCALDLADRGAMTLEDIAVVTNLTRERIRQVELRALIKRARPAAVAMGLGPDDAAALGGRHKVGPGADLEETGVEGAVPSDVATLLTSGGGDDS